VKTSDKGDRQAIVQQAAVLPWRKGATTEVMLITSLGTGRWVLPKGGIEGGSYRYEKLSSDGSIQLCHVTVFAMKVTVQRAIWPEQNRRTTKWHSLQEAAAAVHEDDLRRLILAFDPR
jgi:uncharacterized protein